MPSFRPNTNDPRQKITGFLAVLATTGLLLSACVACPAEGLHCPPFPVRNPYP